MRFRMGFTLALGAFLAVVCGCAGTTGFGPKNEPNDKSLRAAKTLLSWAGPDDEKNGSEKDADKDEKGDVRNEDEPDNIVTDRPDFTEASSTVGRGRLQLESGYTFFQDRVNGTTTRTHSYPELLFRAGLFADWFELRLGQNFQTQDTVTAGNRDRANGATDLYVGVKLFLTEQKCFLPESSLIIQSTIPTGANAFTSRQMMPGLNYLFGWDVIDDFLSIGGSTQANRSVDDEGHYYTTVAQSLTVNYELTKRLKAYTEWFAFFPCGALDPSVGIEHYLDGGFAFLVNNNFQLDIRAGVGLNRRAQDFFVGSGFSVRY